MALPVTMYRWDDPGAPQIAEGRPSEYMNVLKKCLAEGYGTKNPLGWSVETEIADPPVLALKNNTDVGSGGVSFFRADDNERRSLIITEGCNDYVDIDNRGRKSSYFAFDSYSNSSASTLKNWFLIGTGKAFYFYVSNDYYQDKNYTSTYDVICFFQGDFESLYPNDPATFMSMSGVLNSTTFNWTAPLTYRLAEGYPTEITQIHPLDGSDSPSPASLTNLGRSSYVAGKITGVPNITVLSPYYLSMGDGNLSDAKDYQTLEMPFGRGLMPGLYLANDAGYRDEPKPVIKQFDNTDYFLLPSTSSHTGCAWINLKEW